eukprot:gene12695-12826_t
MLPQGQPADPEAMAAHVASRAGAAGVVLDCTASEALADCYASWMGRHGLHIITPNKKLGAGPLPRAGWFKAMTTPPPPTKHAAAFQALAARATVGAGLPVMSTLKSLIETGDTVISIEGILSGTLSYIFNTWQPGQPFSEVVAAAQQQGYTEPDPRDDLSGMDVARKVVILARECGLQLGLDDLKVSSLVPPDLAALPSAAQYMEQLPQVAASPPAGYESNLLLFTC